MLLVLIALISSAECNEKNSFLTIPPYSSEVDESCSPEPWYLRLKYIIELIHSDRFYSSALGYYNLKNDCNFACPPIQFFCDEL
jgi:hypothetical protein